MITITNTITIIVRNGITGTIIFFFSCIAGAEPLSSMNTAAHTSEHGTLPRAKLSFAHQLSKSRSGLRDPAINE